MIFIWGFILLVGLLLSSTLVLNTVSTLSDRQGKFKAEKEKFPLNGYGDMVFQGRCFQGSDV